jgi:hypothetical protein
MSFNKNKKRVLITLVFVVLGALLYYLLSYRFGQIEYFSSSDSKPIVDNIKESHEVAASVDSSLVQESSAPIPVTHISTPDNVKAVYISSWVGGSTRHRDPVIKMIDETELNAIVIDVKDSTGRIGFKVTDPELTKTGSVENRISNIRSLTNMLHEKNIYIIGRVSVFQDPYMTKAKPEWSITKKSDGTLWKDRKGLSFLDPANKEVWKYIVAIARDAYSEGFDEINFDYIRYPSDGDIKNINYHIAQGQTRSDNLESFFKYLREELTKGTPIPMSADLFGLTTESTDDMGIGQIWEKALPYFDFLAPMVYPSHYPPGQDGFKNPADHPYEIISKALAGAIKKTETMPGQNKSKIRPWLQDFDLGAVYTKDMVKAQMKAVYDKGLNSWMLWDPNNKYTPSALELENKL